MRLVPQAAGPSKPTTLWVLRHGCMVEPRSNPEHRQKSPPYFSAQKGVLTMKQPIRYRAFIPVVIALVTLGTVSCALAARSHD
jgi:hypothetical protein